MWLGAVGGSGWLSPIPMPVRPKWREQGLVESVAGMDRGASIIVRAWDVCEHVENSEKNRGLCVHRGYF